MKSFRLILLEAIMTYEQALQTLGLSPNFTKDQLEKSRKRLALQHHPDRPGGDLEKMKLVNVAYDILSRPQNQQKSYPQSTQHKSYKKIDWKRNASYKRFINDLKKQFSFTGDPDDYQVSSFQPGQRNIKFNNAQITKNIPTSVFTIKSDEGFEARVEVRAETIRGITTISLFFNTNPPIDEENLQTFAADLTDNILLDAFNLKD